MIDNKRCILVADDEIRMVRAVKDFLSANGFVVISAQNGEEAIDKYYANSKEIDLVLLDVMMPIYSGLEVLAKIREDSLVPIVMLTARGEEYDQVAGFRAGADDYITKPFSPTILLMRMEAVLKRTGKGMIKEVTASGIAMNASLRTVYLDGTSLELTKREFDLLLFFITNQYLIFTREQLLNNVWGYDFEGDERTVDTHVKQLRTKLGEKGKMIKTVHRVGYKFEEPNK